MQILTKKNQYILSVFIIVTVAFSFGNYDLTSVFAQDNMTLSRDNSSMQMDPMNNMTSMNATPASNTSGVFFDRTPIK